MYFVSAVVLSCTTHADCIEVCAKIAREAGSTSSTIYYILYNVVVPYYVNNTEYSTCLV